MNLRSTNTNGEFRVPVNIENGVFVIIDNSIVKSPILDVPGVSGYIIVIICFWLRCKCTSLMTGNFQP